MRRHLPFRFEKHLIILMMGSFLFMGTTYVIQEGGVEVGRWEEADGSEAVEILENDVPKSVPKALQEPIPIPGDAGYQWTTPETPEGEIKIWKVSGQLIDILRLKGIPAEELIFQFGTQTKSVLVNFEGYFTAELPALEESGYTVTVKATGYSAPSVFVKRKDSFSSMPYEDRLSMLGRLPMWDPIRGTSYDLQLGMIPDLLTEKERSDYAAMMQKKSGGGS